MGMIFTTSTGKPASDEGLDWIYDPSTEDGQELGLSWDTSGMTAHDVLDALGLARGHNNVVEWTADFKDAARKYLETADPEDDYLNPRIQRIINVCTAGEERGAKFLILE